MTHLREAIEPDFDPIDSGSVAFLKLDDGTSPEYAPIDPNYDPTDPDYFDYFMWKLEYGVYPVYVGRVGPQQLSPVVWSVTFVGNTRTIIGHTLPDGSDDCRTVSAQGLIWPSAAQAHLRANTQRSREQGEEQV
jgi:hypothetical protein